MRTEMGRVCFLLGLGVVFGGGCSEGIVSQDESLESKAVEAREQSFDVVEAELNVLPTINEFVVYGQNSVSIRDRAQVIGGDVGVKDVGTGPFLEPNFELSVINGARVETVRSLLGDSIKLSNRSVVGDVQARQLSTSGSPTYGGPYSFPSAMPNVPTLAVAAPGSTAVGVNAGQTRTLSPGAFSAVTLSSNAKLRLQPGAYDFASVQVGNDARIEVLGAVVVRIAGRFAGLDRSRVVAVGGVSPGSIRVEVAGINGNNGALTATPKAAAFGNDSEITGLWLVPNGTLATGQRSVVAGALAARDVLVDIDARVTFQSGFAPPACEPANCDDQNPCTLDSCSAGTCSHLAAAAGLSCADSDLCDGNETCNGDGSCVAGSAVICPEADECHAPGTCNATTGVCSAPTEIEGACPADGGALDSGGAATDGSVSTQDAGSSPNAPGPVSQDAGDDGG